MINQHLIACDPPTADLPWIRRWIHGWSKFLSYLGKFEMAFHFFLSKIFQICTKSKEKWCFLAFLAFSMWDWQAIIDMPRNRRLRVCPWHLNTLSYILLFEPFFSQILRVLLTYQFTSLWWGLYRKIFLLNLTKFTEYLHLPGTALGAEVSNMNEAWSLPWGAQVREVWLGVSEMTTSNLTLLLFISICDSLSLRVGWTHWFTSSKYHMTKVTGYHF